MEEPSKKYIRDELIGSGTYGRAWLVRRLSTGSKYVLKEVHVTGLSDREREQAMIEIEALAKCRHVNVIRYREAFLAEMKTLNPVLCIVMEYAQLGDLRKKIESQNKVLFNEEVIIDWFVQLSFALKYIHGLRILHRDLKTSNIFLDCNGLLKLGDFGIARFLNESADQANTVIGTPYYLSPEICQHQSYDFKSDMWAAGCVLYELCTHNRPFIGSSLTELMVVILRGKYQPIPSQYSPLVKDLVSVLLRCNPTDRPSAAELLNIPLVRPAADAYVQRINAMLDNRLADAKVQVRSRWSSPQQNIRVLCRPRLSDSSIATNHDDGLAAKHRRKSEVTPSIANSPADIGMKITVRHNRNFSTDQSTALHLNGNDKPNTNENENKEITRLRSCGTPVICSYSSARNRRDVQATPDTAAAACCQLTPAENARSRNGAAPKLSFLREIHILQRPLAAGHRNPGQGQQDHVTRQAVVPTTPPTTSSQVNNVQQSRPRCASAIKAVDNSSFSPMARAADERTSSPTHHLREKQNVYVTLMSSVAHSRSSVHAGIDLLRSELLTRFSSHRFSRYYRQIHDVLNQQQQQQQQHNVVSGGTEVDVGRLLATLDPDVIQYFPLYFQLIQLEMIANDQ